MLKSAHAFTVIVRSFWRSPAGVTSIEYAMIASLISIGIIAGATALGSNLNNNYYVKVEHGLS